MVDNNNPEPSPRILRPKLAVNKGNGIPANWLSPDSTGKGNETMRIQAWRLPFRQAGGFLGPCLTVNTGPADAEHPVVKLDAHHGEIEVFSNDQLGQEELPEIRNVDDMPKRDVVRQTRGPADERAFHLVFLLMTSKASASPPRRLFVIGDGSVLCFNSAQERVGLYVLDEVGICFGILELQFSGSGPNDIEHVQGLNWTIVESEALKRDLGESERWNVTFGRMLGGHPAGDSRGLHTITDIQTIDFAESGGFPTAVFHRFANDFQACGFREDAIVRKFQFAELTSPGTTGIRI